MSVAGAGAAPRREPASRGSAWLAASLLCAALAAVFLAFPLGRFFSDSGLLIRRVEAGFDVYYNIAYLPLAWLANTAFGGLFDWSVERCLEVLSAVAGAAAGGFTAAWIARFIEPGARGLAVMLGLTFGALLALAPGAVFFSTLVEVHSLQLLLACVGVAAAVRAGSAARPRSYAWLALALVALLIGHLANVMLVPGVLLLAQRKDASRGIALDRKFWIAVVVAAAVVGVGIATHWRPQYWIESGDQLGFFDSLAYHGHAYFGQLDRFGLFGVDEAAAFLWAEFGRPTGVLLAAPFAAAFAWPAMTVDERRISWRALAAVLPALLVLSQSGLFEGGGYSLTYLPLFALVAAIAMSALLRKLTSERHRTAIAALVGVLLVAGQASLARADRMRVVASGPAPREWAQRVESQIPSGRHLLVTSLADRQAMIATRADIKAWDLERITQLVPRRARVERARQVFTERLGLALAKGDMFVDARLVRSGTGDAWRDSLRSLLDDERLEFEWLGEAPFDMLRVGLRDG